MACFDTALYIQTYRFHKAAIPTGDEEKANFAEKLVSFGVSLTQFKAAFDQAEITM